MRGVALALLMAMLVSACDAAITTQPPATASPSPSTATADGPTFGVRNGLTVPVSLFTNGEAGITVQAGVSVEHPGSVFGPLPWRIEAHSPSGRVLLTLTVPVGAHLTSTGGVAASDDLACGRLELYAGAAPLGPSFIADPSKPCN